MTMGKPASSFSKELKDNLTPVIEPKTREEKGEVVSQPLRGAFE